MKKKSLPSMPSSSSEVNASPKRDKINK